MIEHPEEPLPSVIHQYHLSSEPSSGRSHLPPAPEPFVGRERELSLLHGRLTRGARLVFVTGPSGIGKTTLALAATHRLLAEGHFPDGVLWLDGRDLFSYSNLLDEIARHLGQERVLGRSLELREGYLRQQIAAHDYLLLLDDLDGVEEGQREVVRFLRQVAGTCLVTARLHPPSQDVPERLGALAFQDSYLLLQQVAGHAIPFEDVERLLTRIGDSPLATRLVGARLQDAASVYQVVEEVLHAPTGELRRGQVHGQSPSTLRVLLSVLGNLGDEEQQVLRAASCLRRSFPPRLLAFMVERDEEQVEAALRRLHERGLLDRSVRGWRVHDALRDALRALSLLPQERWQQRAALALSRGSVLDQLDAVEQLQRSGEARRAAMLLLSCLDALIEANLTSQVAAHLAAFAPDIVGRRLWLQISEAQGDVAVASGGAWEAAHFYQRAFAQLQGQPASQENQRVAARLARKQAEVALEDPGTSGAAQSLEEAAAWLRRAVRAASAEDPTERVRIALLHSRLRERQGQWQQALQAAEQARTLAQEGAHELLAACWQRVAELYRAAGQEGVALAALQKALATLPAEGGGFQQGFLLSASGEILEGMGQWDEAISMWEQALPIWRASSLGRHLVRTLHQLGEVVGRQGHGARAIELQQEALGIARLAGLPDMVVGLQVALAAIYLAQGKLEQAEPLLQESLTSAQGGVNTTPLPRLYRTLAAVMQGKGEAEEADALLRRAFLWARRNEDPIEEHRAAWALALVARDTATLETLRADAPVTLSAYDRALLTLELAEHDQRIGSAAQARAHLATLEPALAALGALPLSERVERLRAALAGMG